MYRLLMATGIVVAICFAMGCGGSGSENASADVTKAEFIKQADKTCKKFEKNREAAAVVWMKTFPGGPQEAEAHLSQGLKEVVAPSIRQEAQALASLSVPAKDEAEISKMVDDLTQASKGIAENGRKGLYRSGVADFEKGARAYGMNVCSDLS